MCADSMTRYGDDTTTSAMTDGLLPHHMPQTAIELGDELLGWRCVACGKWIREYGPIDRSECPVDWRHNDGEA